MENKNVPLSVSTSMIETGIYCDNRKDLWSERLSMTVKENSLQPFVIAWRVSVHDLIHAFRDRRM